MEQWLDALLDQEVVYTAMAARCEKTDDVWFLTAPELPEHAEANRALRMRTNRQTPEAVARTVVEFFRSRGLTPIADVDPIAERQGIGEALRRVGFRLDAGNRVLMRYAHQSPPLPLAGGVEVRIVPNETGKGEAADWIEMAVSDDVGWPDEALWRAVAACEARYTSCRLYLGLLKGQPAGACDLFQHAGWGRVDSVATRPEMRRRGVASALVTRAIQDSLTSGNNITYLFTEPGTNAERLYLRLGFERWHVNVLRRHRA